jgi:predicted metalloprotease with PDZ domain
MRALVLLPALAVSSLIAAQDVPAQVRIKTAPGGYAFAVGDPDRPMIGISTRSSGKRDTLGLLVESVTRDGPADKAGIEEGDRLVAVNSVNLRLSPADAGESDMDGVANRRLIRELEKQKAGDEVELRVYRDGNTRSVRVKTVTADELNKEAFASTTSSLRRKNDRAVLGISLGGNGSRRDTLGVLVVGVANDGPAAKAGIDEGDRVVAINGVDLRVAGEDAGDWQASNARINRLNREMEKVKAGDAVELRVYSAGQTKTVRVEAAKASDVEGQGFFFNGNALGRVRTLTMPRGGTIIRTRPPMAEFDLKPAKEAIEADVERSMKTMKELLKERSTDAKLKSEAVRKLMTARTLRIA